MNLFAGYPKWGECDPRPLRGMSNCRHEYGLRLQQLTGQMRCAYCETSLVDTYEHWLLMAVDHVIPKKCVPKEQKEAWERWTETLYNVVLCCSGCNGFCNKSELRLPPTAPPSFEEFCRIRDDVFGIRSRQIRDRAAEERAFYESKPWELRHSR